MPSLDQLVSAGQPHPPSCHEPDHEHGDEHHCFGIPGHQLPGSSFGFKVTTRSISLKANELIVAFVTSDGPNPRLHLSGGGLHWTWVAQAGRRLRGDSQVWEAETTAAVRTSISASLESAGLVRSLTVASFEGAGIPRGRGCIRQRRQRQTDSAPHDIQLQLVGLGRRPQLDAATNVRPRTQCRTTPRFHEA